MMPNHSLAPNSFPGDIHQGNTWVPVDDVSSWIFCYAYHPDRALTTEERDRFAKWGGVFSAVEEHYFPYANRENDYQIDRELQKQGNFTGIRGISEQDAAIADSQGLIADRARVVRSDRSWRGSFSPHDARRSAHYRTTIAARFDGAGCVQHSIRRRHVQRRHAIRRRSQRTFW